MKPLLLDELVNAESIWRPIVISEQPLFGDLPIETVEPDPKHQRHWMFATDNNKVLAHVYKPDYVLKKFEEIVVPIYCEAYGFKTEKSERERLAKRLVQDTFTYLLFHELFHPVFCPKSKADKENFDVALKNGIKRAEPHLSPRDLMNKVGNSRNTMLDFFIDNFFHYYSQDGNAYGRRLQSAFEQRRDLIGNNQIRSLPDGIITTWDIVELADHKPETLFYPITRAMYGLLFSRSEQLRGAVFDYFRKAMGRAISDADLEKAIVGSLSGLVKYIDQSDLARMRLDKNKYLDAVAQLYANRDKPNGSSARPDVVRAIIEIGTRTEYRYPSLEGVIEPLAKYIHTQKEEGKHSAPNESQEQTQAEQALQSLINQNDPDTDNMLTSVANDQSPPRTRKNIRLSNLAKDEYYKRNAQELPIKSPLREAVTVNVGMRRRPVKLQELLLTPDQVVNLPIDSINQFQLETGIQCLFQLSPHQFRYDIYEWIEEPIKDFTYVKSGIILPDNVVFRVDGSGSMLTPGGAAFVGSKSRYDLLMHVVYGVAKSASKAAREMNKEIQVVGVSYSNPGNTRVSKPVEMQPFYATPNNDVKEVLLNPDGGSTHHDMPAYQTAYKQLKPGKNLDIIITDGDLDSDHDQSLAELRKILSVQDNHVVYFPIFQEGRFAGRVRMLAHNTPNLTYQPFLNFDALQAAATGILIQYSRAAERFGVKSI